MENVVTVIFNVESEAYQAFTQIRNKPFGKDYVVAEAAQIKREGDTFTVIDTIDAAAVTSDDTAAGMVIGSLVGILGGPLGVLLGAYSGTLTGAAFDLADAVDSASLAEVTAAKLQDGDVAIIALVQEEEPAFDAALEGFDVTIIRRFAADVADEVEKALQVQEELAVLAREQLRADAKAELKQKHEEHVASIAARFEEIKAKAAQLKADSDAEMDAYLDGLAEKANAINAKAAELDAAVGDAIKDIQAAGEEIEDALN